MHTKLLMLGSFHLSVWDFWVTHVSPSIRLCGIEAGLSFGGSVKELQVDFAQNSHLMRGSSPCRSPADAPQKVQHRRSDSMYHSGYVLHYATRKTSI
jgi:hypothetical protein